ncbi:MAG: YfbK domain-containing protein [Verrucomicrobiota bacterium]
MTETIQPELQSWRRATSDFRFASAVGLFGLILREHPSAEKSDLRDVLRIASNDDKNDPFGYRAEFITLVERLMENEKAR